MSSPTTLYRFRIEVSDIERAAYDSLDFRVAQHPSESLPYLLSRALAYALNYEPDLAFSPKGLGDPDAPALTVPNNQGGVKLWIEIGNPSARKLHKASKAAKIVKVYTYKNPENLIQEIKTGDVHRAEHIELFSFSTSFIDSLTELLKKDNSWDLVLNDGNLLVSSGEESAQGELRRHHI